MDFDEDNSEPILGEIPGLNMDVLPEPVQRAMSDRVTKHELLVALSLALSQVTAKGCWRLSPGRNARP
jgi:hypothetical protein